MPRYRSLKALATAIQVAVLARFGVAERYLAVDRLLTQLLIYHDVRELVSTEAVLEALQALTSAPGDSRQRLQQLHDQIRALRIAWIVANHAEPQTAVSSFASIGFLTDAQTETFKGIVAAYTGLSDLVDFAAIQIPDNARVYLDSIDEACLQSYMTALYDSQRWKDPRPILFDTDQLVGAFDEARPFVLPQTITKLLISPERYDDASSWFERLKQPFLTDVARLMAEASRFVIRTSAGETDTQALLASAREILDRLAPHSFDEFAVFGEWRDLVLSMYGALLMTLGGQGWVAREERQRYMQRAEDAFAQSSSRLLKAYCPMLRWTRAQLSSEPQRRHVENSAVDLVNQLLADSALEEDPGQRLMTMTMLAGLPAGWKFSKNDFDGAIEAARQARAFAEASAHFYAGQFGPILSDLKDADVAAMDVEARAQFDAVRALMDAALAGISSIMLISDTLILNSQAKQAEGQGDFTVAAERYRSAAELQKESFDNARRLIGVFFAVVESKTLLASGYQLDARAAYYQGMGALNRGDQLLIEGNFAGANDAYADATLTLTEAEVLWAREVERLGPMSGEMQTRARTEYVLVGARVRYCEAKKELALAERSLATIDEPLQAARHFEAAARVFREILTMADPSEQERALDLFKGSLDFCSGRMLLELARDSRDPQNVQEGKELLDRAALTFDQLGEEHWSQYVRGLRFEYEAVFAWIAAQSRNAMEAAVYSELARNKAYDAASIFRALGVEKRARSLEGKARAASIPRTYDLTTIVLPKPPDPTMATLSAPQGSMSTAADRSITTQVLQSSTELQRIHARIAALDGTLEQSEERYNRGTISEGQYSLLTTGLFEERNLLRGRLAALESQPEPIRG